MAERTVVFTSGNVTLAEAQVGASIFGGTDQDVSVSSLPSAPIAGARAVRIRVSGTFTVAPGGPVTFKVRQGQGAAGAVVMAPSFSLTPTPAINSPFQFEVWDANPVPPLAYSVTGITTVTQGTCFLIIELEEVN